MSQSSSIVNQDIVLGKMYKRDMPKSQDGKNYLSTVLKNNKEIYGRILRLPDVRRQVKELEEDSFPVEVAPPNTTMFIYNGRLGGPKLKVEKIVVPFSDHMKMEVHWAGPVVDLPPAPAAIDRTPRRGRGRPRKFQVETTEERDNWDEVETRNETEARVEEVEEGDDTEAMNEAEAMEVAEARGKTGVREQDVKDVQNFDAEEFEQPQRKRTAGDQGERPEPKRFFTTEGLLEPDVGHVERNIVPTEEREEKKKIKELEEKVQKMEENERTRDEQEKRKNEKWTRQSEEKDTRVHELEQQLIEERSVSQTRQNELKVQVEQLKGENEGSCFGRNLAQEAVKELQAQRFQEKEELKKAGRENRNLSKKCMNLEQEKQKLNSSLSETSIRVRELARENTSLRRQNEGSQRTIDLHDTVTGRLRKDTIAAKKEAGELRTQNAEITKNASEAVQEMKNKIEEMRSEHSMEIAMLQANQANGNRRW